ncbi:hypothetical protein [Aquimarina sp. RZ0]|uniref:hypothetical protein n=1 Tax=Aquimarina sp. RZ0 TaxID=2607730 RepID=UPI0011F26292|nr:hypothetical protein [Aquimarina sp. RZ0]KAA1243086.1 hypothetical protein F0000_22555 [Aquimarina sp. RZ0]
MKIKLLLSFVICMHFSGVSQISIGSSNKEQLTNFDKEILAKFKNTKTIFLLSDVFDKNMYQSILKDSWTVTDYELISYKDFKIEDYLSDAYSIAQISGLDKTRNTNPKGASTGLFTFIDFRIYDHQSIKKDLAKLSPKKKAKNKHHIIAKYSHQVARFYLYPNDQLIEATRHKGVQTVVNSMFSENVFLNYTPGLLKNYFQKINTTIASEKGYAMYTNDHLPAIQKLAIEKLYIPEYSSITYNGRKGKDNKPNHTSIQNLFKNYEFMYEIVSDSDLSDRIMHHEEFYYLRYVRVNGERFVQVVNSASGEVIYRNHLKGLSYKIKPKLVIDLNEKIKKSGTTHQKKEEAIVSTQ